MSTMVKGFLTRALALGFFVFAFAPLSAQLPEKPVPVPGSYDGGYLVFQSADGAFKYWVDGRLQVDAASYWGGENAMGNGTEIRRARLGVKTLLYRDWYAEIDVDFASNLVEIKDAWVGYTGFTNTLIKAGHYKAPFSLETLTSSKNITFMERSYADNFSLDRLIGAGVAHWGKQWQVAAGAFGQAAGTIDATGRNEGYGFAGRATVAPVLGDRKVVHVGFALGTHTPDAAAGADTNTVRFRARPETYVAKIRYLSTGKIRLSDHTNYLNAEAAIVLGSFSLQGEYSQVGVHRLNNLATASFNGGYVFASFFLTGDTRVYLPNEGEFDRIVPRKSGGAWELALRYSTMDLNDTDPDVNILGGSADNYTVGLNWYINTNFKWMLNYTRVINDQYAKPDFGIPPLVAGDKFNMLQTRVSLAF